MSHHPSSNSTAGPSSTPRNPVRLSVAQHSSSSTSESQKYNANEQNPVNVEDDTLIRAAVRKAQLQRRVDRWMDRLMEETVDRSTFQKIVSHLTPPQYLEITHERHLNTLCSYPLCPNPPKREYSTAKRYVISTSARTIKPKEGNEEDGFCSKKCSIRSDWVRKNLSEEAVWLRVNTEELELLEELEDRGEFTWNDEGGRGGRSRDGINGMKRTGRDTGSLIKNGTKIFQIPSSGLRVNPTATSSNYPASTIPKDKENTTIKSLNKVPAPEPPTKENPISTLLANLQIHERPTPSTPPIAPSLTKPTLPSAPAPDSTPQSQPRSQPQSQPQPQTQTTSSPTKSSSPRNPRRTPTSLIDTSTSQLSNTFVNASKALGPIAQDDSDQEEEKEESDPGWGDDDHELDGFWEEARLARELVDEEH